MSQFREEMNSSKEECAYARNSDSINYSNFSPSSTTSSSYSISPQELQNMIINTNQMYLTNTGSSNSPSSSTSSMSPSQVKSEPNQYQQYGTSDPYLDMSMSEDLDTTNNESIKMKSSNGNKVNRFFADGVVDVLNKWFVDNQNYPYPDENMTNILAKEANISAKQVRKWFANKRVRSNKCCKQSIKPKKEPKSRRQTKSVSEVDGVQLTFNMTDSDEFNATTTDIIDDLNESTVIKRNTVYSSHKKSKRASCYLNSSSGMSASPSFIESPVFRSDYSKNNNESLYERFEEIRIRKQMEQQELFDSYNNNVASFKYNNQSLQQHNYDQQNDATNASLLCNNLLNSTDQQNRIALAAAIYGPLFVMNLLQNPQIAFANQLISNNNNSNNNNISEEKFKQYNKRKTHLSNCYIKETNQLTSELSIDLTSNKQNKCSSSSSSSIDPDEFNTTPTSTSSSSSYSSPLTMFDSYNFAKQSNHIVPHQHQQKPTRKINFGDISDLIN